MSITHEAKQDKSKTYNHRQLTSQQFAFNRSKVKTLRLVAQLKFICFGMDFLDRQIDLCSKQIDPNIHIALRISI